MLALAQACPCQGLLLLLLLVAVAPQVSRPAGHPCRGLLAAAAAVGLTPARHLREGRQAGASRPAYLPSKALNLGALPWQACRPWQGPGACLARHQSLGPAGSRLALVGRLLLLGSHLVLLLMVGPWGEEVPRSHH